MEPTNELVTKAEANAEGFNISSTNANLPTPPPIFHMIFHWEIKGVL